MLTCWGAAAGDFQRMKEDFTAKGAKVAKIEKAFKAFPIWMLFALFGGPKPSDFPCRVYCCRTDSRPRLRSSSGR